MTTQNQQLKDYGTEDTRDLKSSVFQVGEIVDQIIQFKDGNKKTFRGVIVASIEQSEFTRFDLLDGRRIYINTKNVDWFEVHKRK